MQSAYFDITEQMSRVYSLAWSSILLHSNLFSDEEDPVITCPAPFTVGTDDGLDTATVTFDPANVTDNSMLSITPVSYPVSGSNFSIGDTEVQFNATDVSGNTASCTFTVTVEGKF